ncbi:PspC domain-containing protein [Thermomonospora umbrina]|uniref:Phage shock protein C (PspC) family protein n=1 Tax=Thermomonospora umbrina TaxID=111806 RepID=A0A3D9SQY8_9ACTN|nr:PspC domain-containing protein [Thermomonospora umbrina]REE98228.1 phage shock protein C (PspC) family protein [Thermomonospora umbrina]
MAAEDTTQSRPALARSHEGRIVVGVCVGLGRRTGVDPVVLRVGFAVLTLAGGQGVLLYVAAWLLMPTAEHPSKVERMLRRRFDDEAVLTVLGGLLGLSTLVTMLSEGMSDYTLAGLTVFALVALVAHARHVDFLAVARGLPERLQGHAPRDDVPRSTVDLTKTPPPSASAPLPEGMIDLATLSRPDPADVPTAAPAVPAPTGHTATAVRPERAPHPRQRTPALTSVTLLGALAVGAAMIPAATASDSGAHGAQLVMAPALAVIGLGLLVGGWFGRARGLTTVGAMLTVGLLATTAAAEIPGDARFGDVEWRPSEAPHSEQTYRVAVGDGRLDLTALPLPVGRRVRINAQVLAGRLRITVPNNVRVEVDGRAALGDITVDGRVTGGPNARVDTVMEPETGQAPAVIELRIRARLADVEVNRG